MVNFTVFKGSKEGKIVEATTTRNIEDDEVLIKVTHSGLCGTDEHYRHADMVLGHEGAGVVEVSTFSSLLPERLNVLHKGKKRLWIWHYLETL
jgi:threonine dehydrogenase-like Zn-dependent dehydrogenase